MVEVNKERAAQVLQLLNEIRVQGKIRKGTNETTKSVERGEAKLVVIAADVNPQEIILHLPALCEEKGIAYVWVESKADLGAAAGLPVGTSAVAVANAGDASKKLTEFIEVIKGGKPKAEKKTEEGSAEKTKEEKKPKAKKEASKPKEEEVKPAE